MALNKTRNARGGGIEFYYAKVKGWCTSIFLPTATSGPLEATGFMLTLLERPDGLPLCVCLTDEALLQRDEVKKVLDGDSAIGKLEPYFIDTPTFNKKHGIEDDSGYGEANGYGTVAVDLAAEAAKQKEVMKALRKSDGQAAAGRHEEGPQNRRNGEV